MDKEWLKKVGSIQQEAYIRKVEYLEGRAGGMKAYQLKSGPLMLTAAEDKCLDITELSWKGINFNFISKPGLQNRQAYDYQGFAGQRSIMGGLFFTCGTDNVGTPDVSWQNMLPMHGSLRSTPAEHVCADSYWEDGEYKLRLSGEMRQAALFGGNMALRRSIETSYGSKRIVIRDEFENQAYESSPFMLLYHFNLGYPLLDEDTQLCIPASRTILIGEDKETERTWNKVDAPVDGLPEEVFYHTLKADDGGYARVSAYNKRLGAGLEIGFRTEELPRFTQWKSMASGDYVIGFEPCNCHVKGQVWEKENGTLVMMEAGEKKVVELTLRILEKEDAER